VGNVVAFLNKKGGVGKTSTVHHLGGEAARRGLRVLLVDADPQVSLTQGLLGPEAARRLDPRDTIAALFDPGADPDAARLVVPLGAPGAWLLPGSGGLDTFNRPDPWDAGPGQYALRDALQPIRHVYDLILVDCPPHIYLSAWAAMVAADGVVVPLQAEDYGAQGVASIQDSIDHARDAANPGLRLLGFLVTMYQRNLTVHAGYERDLRSLYGGAVFASVVPSAKDFKEAVMLRRAVCDHRPRSAAARSIAILADELIARLAAADDDRRAA